MICLPVMSSYQYSDPHVKIRRRPRGRLIFIMGISIIATEPMHIPVIQSHKYQELYSCQNGGRYQFRDTIRDYKGLFN